MLKYENLFHLLTKKSLSLGSIFQIDIDFIILILYFLVMIRSLYHKSSDYNSVAWTLHFVFAFIGESTWNVGSFIMESKGIIT